MRVHIDEGRPDVVRFEINGGKVGGCRRACRLNRSDPLILDQKVKIAAMSSRTAALRSPITPPEIT